ncbi:MAG TPA: FkbM family methyltransferase [Syntrophobacteraceae bacterium]|nr:FkbM family methyltransferase [Syntrophobacteraceae bacterium]
MIKPHHPGLLNAFVKRTTPFISRVFLECGFTRFLPLLESYVCFIQGKGAGTGWNLQGEILAALPHIRRHGAVILDVGANVGEWSIRVLEALGAAECRLFLFEPSAYCRRVLGSLNLPRTTIIPAAVGDKAGTAAFNSPEPGSPIGSLHPRRDSYFQEFEFFREQVNVVTIDDFMDDYEIDMVDFMKLDIEGNELAALLGAGRALDARRIRALTFEFGSQHINSRTFFHDFWDLLHPAGFSVYRICPGGFLIPIEEYYEDLEYFRGVTNYLATLHEADGHQG